VMGRLCLFVMVAQVADLNSAPGLFRVFSKKN
jgi:hypothetical protein